LNPTDYRIHSRKDLLRGVVLELRAKNGVTYASVRLSDGRTLPFVRYQGSLAVGQRVLLRYDAGTWSIEG